MSIIRARNVLNKRASDKPVLFDMPNHREFNKYLTGKDCLIDTENVITEVVQKLDVDILMCSIPYAPKDVKEIEKDSNLYGLDPTAWRNSDTTEKDIENHNPLLIRPHLGKTDFEIRQMMIGEDARNRLYAGGTALTHGFVFTTCMHYAAEDLDYEDFLCFCLQEPELTEKLFDRYEAISDKQIKAWTDINVELMLCHDDIANTNSTTLSPDFLRKNIFPRYKRLYSHAKEKGIPVFAMTDGNFIGVAKDYIDAGADGFFIDTPTVNIEKLIKICGEEKFYFTAPSPATFTTCSSKEVKKEMDKYAEISKTVKGFIYHMPGGWTRNMPIENVKEYYAAQKRI